MYRNDDKGQDLHCGPSTCKARGPRAAHDDCKNDKESSKVKDKHVLKPRNLDFRAVDVSSFGTCGNYEEWLSTSSRPLSDR